KMTIDSLDKEMKQKEDEQDAGGVGCLVIGRHDFLFPRGGQHSLAAVPHAPSGSRLALRLVAAPAAPPTDAEVMQRAFEKSRRELRAAVAKLD
ncbi:hypothetical protein NL533_30285, partial [Klebsiella pneumoniae]|nr:hypothetical protein [Klebsiella pneumoniae]